MNKSDANDDFSGGCDRQVPAAEFIRAFSKWRELAHKHPIEITNHGRVSHVLTTLEYFDRIGMADHVVDDPAEANLFGLADWVNDSIIVCNEREEIVFANRFVIAVCQLKMNPQSPKTLTQTLPDVSGTLFEVNFRRTLLGREPISADIPSPFKQDAWLNLRSFPLRDKTVLMFRDITEEVQRHRLADVKEAILSAISVHGSMGYVRLSVRGTIDRADESFCNWMGLAPERLIGVPLVDLVARAGKAEFREKLEKVLMGGKPIRTSCAMQSNLGEAIRLNLGLVQLHGAYGAEGAVVVFARDDLSCD